MLRWKTWFLFYNIIKGELMLIESIRPTVKFTLLVTLFGVLGEHRSCSF